jgi:hypothetical protein
MALIETNLATEQFNASSKNLDALLGLKEPAKREEVTTAIAIVCLDEIQKSKLGWNHYIKKFFATTLTYASVIALPFIALAGAIWHYSEQIKALTAIYEAKNIALAGTGVGALFLADYAVGKVFGIRPITALLIGAFDAYRRGAKILSNQVRDSYTNDEVKTEIEILEHRKTIKAQLSAAYLGIAVELGKRQKNETLKTDLETLKANLPLISRGLSEIALSKVEICEILSPLEETMKLLDGFKLSTLNQLPPSGHLIEAS